MAVATRALSGSSVRARARDRGCTGRPALALVAGVFTAAALPIDAFAAEGLNLAPDPVKLGINLVALLILIYPVKRWLLVPLARILEERDARTVGADDQSSELQLRADDLADEVEAKLRDARAASQRERTSILAKAEAYERHVVEQAREEAAHRIAALRDSLGEELEQARTSLRGESSTLAHAAASRILGRSL